MYVRMYIMFVFYRKNQSFMDKDSIVVRTVQFTLMFTHMSHACHMHVNELIGINCPTAVFIWKEH